MQQSKDTANFDFATAYKNQELKKSIEQYRQIT